MNILDFSDYVIFIRGFDDIHASRTIVRLPLDHYDSATFSSMAKNGLKHERGATEIVDEWWHGSPYQL